MTAKISTTSTASITVQRKAPLFNLGTIVATPGALDLLDRTGTDATSLLEQHQRGEWGETLSTDDAQANNLAVRDGGRILSAYSVGENGRLWIITEWDRSATTLLLPEEY
jgi:hypothetical protein